MTLWHRYLIWRYNRRVDRMVRKHFKRRVDTDSWWLFV